GAQVTASASGISELAVTNAAGGYSLSVPPGSYTVQAGAAGYQAAGITGVTVAANTTTTRNLALTPLPRYTISGAVRDAGGGWPLYARVMISADPLPPLAPYDDFWTGAVDGSFSVTLPAGSYSVQVRPWAAGYPDTTFTLVVSANGTQDFLLTPDPYTCSAPGYTSSGTATLFSSGFEGMATLPAGGWAQLATSGNTAMWTIPTSSNLPTAAPHGGARMALLNSYSAASGDANRLYRTSGVDLSGVNNARLSFWFFHYQGIYTGNDQVQPQVSTNGGASWTNLGDPVLREASNGGWTQYTIDLSAYTGAGMSSVRLAFLGLSGYGYSMLLDDVSITSGGCSANPDGLVVGTIRDQNTGLPLSGASAGYTGASAASGSDGFYTLFAPAGARSISAAKSLYTTGSATVNVPLGGGVQQDFNLAAGQLTTTGADALWVSLPPGGSTALSFTLHNTGSAAAAYTFNEAVRSPAASAAANIGVPPSYRAMADATMAIRHGVFRFPRGFTYLDDAPQADRRLNVLLLCADAAPCGPLDTILVGYPDIGRVDSWPAALAGRTPSLAELAGYDAVIAWSNFAFLEPARLGDVLADYVDGGGRLVLAAFDWSPPESGGLAGRLVEQGYTPLIGTGQANRSAVSQLGAFDAAHPILYGVSQAADFYRDRTTLNPGAYLLAGWADGEPFVALKGRVAAINAYLGRGYAWTGDLGKIVHNTLVHLAAPQAGLSWLSESPADGGLPAGAQQAVTLNFDAAGLATGSYRGTLSIGHDTPYIVNSLPVTLTVTTATTGLLQGRVLGWDVCGTNRFALAGADLQISPGSLSLVSAADGSYTSYLAGGSYTVQVSASGYLPASVVVLLQNGLTTTQDFSLTSTQPCRRIYLPLAVRP
ncbi:MAG: carboxypeptidase regulatory-like domain-containing protein, partial [Chloroflexota bacterium]